MIPTYVESLLQQLELYYVHFASVNEMYLYLLCDHLLTGLLKDFISRLVLSCDFVLNFSLSSIVA